MDLEKLFLVRCVFGGVFSVGRDFAAGGEKMFAVYTLIVEHKMNCWNLIKHVLMIGRMTVGKSSVTFIHNLPLNLFTQAFRRWNDEIIKYS